MTVKIPPKKDANHHLRNTMARVRFAPDSTPRPTRRWNYAGKPLSWGEKTAEGRIKLHLAPQNAEPHHCSSAMEKTLCSWAEKTGPTRIENHMDRWNVVKTRRRVIPATPMGPHAMGTAGEERIWTERGWMASSRQDELRKMRRKAVRKWRARQLTESGARDQLNGANRRPRVKKEPVIKSEGLSDGGFSSL